MSHEFYIATPNVLNYDTELDSDNLPVYENAEAASEAGLHLIMAKQTDLDDKFGEATTLQRLTFGWENLALAKTEAENAFDVFGTRIKPEPKGKLGKVLALLRREK